MLRGYEGWVATGRTLPARRRTLPARRRTLPGAGRLFAGRILKVAVWAHPFPQRSQDVPGSSTVVSATVSFDDTLSGEFCGNVRCARFGDASTVRQPVSRRPPGAGLVAGALREGQQP